jgi:hypothetical protein
MRLSSTKYVSEIAVRNVICGVEYVPSFVERSTSPPYFFQKEQNAAHVAEKVSSKFYMSC